ncbi:Peroxyureidoacrylate/ureidoacrylate amidohydrolase RutB [Pigmentiphaga humi]|uniref:Peroxyureidoacrylate/ureidoacrylate amidohydrolase RutB n=1 Tax=Pigmentiphaga humi TaxID=2478468 RepID=A0A3P4B6I6_9BURK|nr:cysteine hydrolase [Pigmentiphaga humi]VCU71903.1 Peroxyureidoacrylate/ureidoacrylate amidohydrolase RutB [Pigmentiphaga humi]
MQLILDHRIQALGEVDPRRTALIGIHWQNDILDPEGAFGPIFAARAAELGLVPRVRRVFDAARAIGMAMVHVKVVYEPGHAGVLRNNALFRTVCERDAFVRGTPGSEFATPLGPQPGEMVVEHDRISVFYRTGLADALRERGIDTLVFTGVATNVAVDHSVRDAVEDGFTTVLLEDCCCSSNASFHEAGLLTLRALSTHVLEAEHFLAWLHAR